MKIIRIYMALLALLLILSSITACRRGGSGEVPTNTGTEQPTEVGGTEAPTDEPEPSYPCVLELDLTRLLVDGTSLFDGNPHTALSDRDNCISLQQITASALLELEGSVRFDRAPDCFGYTVDGSDPVYGHFIRPTEQADGTTAARSYAFSIAVPLYEMTAGAHTVTFVARLADGTVTPLRAPVTVNLPGVSANTSTPFHASVAAVGDASLSDAVGHTATGAIPVRCDEQGITARDDGTLSISGWVAVSGGVERYMWTVDGVNWFEALTNGTDGEPSSGHFASLGYENATHNAMIPDLMLDLGRYGDRMVDVTVGAVPAADPHAVVPFLTLQDLRIPLQPKDIVTPHHFRADSNADGTPLEVSDLAKLFNIHYGAGDMRSVGYHGSTLCYNLSGIHAMYTNINGRFAMKATVTDMKGGAYFFVRGYHVVYSDSLRNNIDGSKGIFPLTHYYETDGAGAMGGAGIYVRLSEGELTVMVKHYDPENLSRVGNYTVTVPCEGSELTVADDGRTVHVLVDGKSCIRVEMQGMVTYPDINELSPNRPFAATATITMPDGVTHTVKDTLVAYSCNAQCGLTVRGGEAHIAALSLLPLGEAGLVLP